MEVTVLKKGLRIYLIIVMSATSVIVLIDFRHHWLSYVALSSSAICVVCILITFFMEMKKGKQERRK